MKMIFQEAINVPNYRERIGITYNRNKKNQWDSTDEKNKQKNSCKKNDLQKDTHIWHKAKIRGWMHGYN